MKTDNEIIAEFMGVKQTRVLSALGKPVDVYILEHFGMFSTSFELKFDKSWEWLMPVVHKILRTWTPLSGEWPYEYCQLNDTGLGNSIEQVYYRTVQFIKWYNEQYKNNA